jgi:hypothetical protein
MKFVTSLLISLLLYYSINGQGCNANFLLGYTTGIDTNVISKRGVIQFDSLGYALDSANFKMPFMTAQGNLSDENGNLLMASNGCWIADATGDTMMNGGGLLTNSFSVPTWCNSFSGLPFQNSAVFIPHPNDTNLVYLLHQSGTSSSNFKSSGLYYTLVNKSLNNNLGAVVAGQKNQLTFQMGLNPGIAVTKHANGRDWWVLVFKDSSDIVYTFNLSPLGFSAPTVQSLGVFPAPVYLLGQMNFSPNGKKFAYTYYDGTIGAVNNYIRIFDFDRCTGILTISYQILFSQNLFFLISKLFHPALCSKSFSNLQFFLPQFLLPLVQFFFGHRYYFQQL